MSEVLKFTPVEGHVVLEFHKKNSKITPNRQIDIALKILEKQEISDLEDYFVPVYNAMVHAKAEEAKRQQEELEVGSNDNPDNEPEIA